MTRTWISADAVFDGLNFHAAHALAVSDGQVCDFGPVSDVSGRLGGHIEGTVMPGFVDIQVNGGGGVMLNSNPTAGGIAQIAEAHRALGTVALLPTVISDTPKVLAQAVDAVLESRDVPGVVGLHIEGPHISLARRGVHSAEAIRPMDEGTMRHVARLRSEDMPVLITVAPESVSHAQISELVDLGAVVSLGHSHADAATTAGAVDAGARCFTHLFNAMSPMQSRAPGMVGAAIASDVWCSIIPDGVHVDPMMVALAVRARPVADRMIAVSDAMATVGGPDHFELYGERIEVVDGVLRNAEGALAGAHLTMAQSATNLIAFGVPPEAALRMCRHNPAQLLGLWDQMQLIGAPVDDLIVLDHSFRFQGMVGDLVTELFG